jgi:hypothetical protein
VPIKVKELYIASPENRKSIIIVKTIYANRRDPLSPFIITLRQKIINSWVLKELVSSKHITCTLISYTNNEVIMQYLNYLIKYSKAKLKKL